MKYRLKDHELQAMLDDISGGDFSESLNIAVKDEIVFFKHEDIEFDLDIDRLAVEFGIGVDSYSQSKQFKAVFEPGTVEECEDETSLKD